MHKHIALPGALTITFFMGVRVHVCVRYRASQRQEFRGIPSLILDCT